MRIGTCVIAAAAAVACAACVAYRPSSFVGSSGPFLGTHVTIGCIDLAVAQTDAPNVPGRVVAYTFGNHCAHAAQIDLASVHVVGHYADGPRPVHALDPKRELRVLRIAAFQDATEQIAYVGADGSAPSAMCLDLGRVDPDAPVSLRWVCVGAWDLGAGDALGMGASDPAPPDAVADPLTGWPLAATPDPSVLDMPDAAQTSPDTVGRYLAARIHEPRRLVKAIHDYVVLRLHYDTETAAQPDEISRPSQLAEDVFVHRTAVCEGYARLMVALGSAAGVEIAYVTGDARDVDDPLGTTLLAQHPHAWNAAKIAGRWTLIDATWDTPDRGDDRISTRYLFMPPALFRTTHLPDDASWTLITPPLSMRAFEIRLHAGAGERVR